MSPRLALGLLLLAAACGSGCSGVTADSVPRASRAPDVRCMTPAPAGSPGQDPNAQPMFFFLCMQSP